jgi:hypothetical protein
MSLAYYLPRQAYRVRHDMQTLAACGKVVYPNIVSGRELCFYLFEIMDARQEYSGMTKHLLDIFLYKIKDVSQRYTHMKISSLSFFTSIR